jgi:hypothetical protein
LSYTVTNAVNVPAGTKIRLEFANINNPLNPNTNYKVIVTTRNAGNTIIDGPTQSTAYTMKQIGSNVIANNAVTTPKIVDGSITSSKPAYDFMKLVTLQDDTVGNALGWNPNGISTDFSIEEPDHKGFISIVVDSLGSNQHCDPVTLN